MLTYRMGGKRTVVADTALTPRCTSSTSAPENFLAKMSSTKLSSSVHGPLHICFSVLFCGSTYSACLRICLISAVRRILLLFPGAGSSGSYLLLRDRHLKYHLRVRCLFRQMRWCLFKVVLIPLHLVLKICAHHPC